MSVFIDFHVLQTVPPSCVNRDDMGSPKTAVYGGAVRASFTNMNLAAVPKIWLKWSEERY